MKPVERQKLCVHCDGRVPYEATVCPYCSADLSKSQETSDPLSRNQAIQDSLTSLYAPPYKTKPAEQVKTASCARVVPPAHHGGLGVAPGTLPRNEEETRASKHILVATLGLSLGSLLFILGLLQVFFSEAGSLRLEWNTKYWFIYALTGLPLLYFGYRKADTIK